MSFTTLLYIITALLGLCVGSFLNVCILRLPRHESVVTGPSHCDACGRRLRPYELVPLFSYIALRGRCAGCGARIPVLHPLVEAGNALLWVLLLWRFGPAPLAALSCLLASALLALSVIDARTREIPPGFPVFILLLGALRLALDLPDWPLYVIGLFAVSLPLYLVAFLSGGRALGGGDVKLMAACGLFLGWKNILLAFFLACLLGSVLHLTLMALKKAGRSLAMGPYLSAGVLLALVWGDALLGWYLSLF